MATSTDIALQDQSVPSPALARFIRWLAATTLILVVVWVLTQALSPWYRLGINGTDSLPGLVYLVFNGELPNKRGDVIAFYPPSNRFYPERMFFVKKAMGLPGDSVTRQGQDFFINRRWVAMAKTRSNSGNSLAPGPEGIIPEGSWFVWTPHPDSYDSRYADIGWIPKDRVIGRAVRLF